MSDARAAVLAKIRAGIPHGRPDPAVDYASIEREYRRAGSLTEAELIELFASRIVHYDGSVRRCGRATVSATIADVLGSRGKQRIHVPADIDVAWLPSSIVCERDNGLLLEDLDQAEGVLTGCTVAIAETGTLVLTHGAGEGRRALTLVPDYHLAVVGADQIVETVPEALQRAAEHSPTLITTISGPSATADIEMTRIKGVHGPRTLDVIIVTTAR